MISSLFSLEQKYCLSLLGKIKIGKQYVRNFSYRVNKNLKLVHPLIDDDALQVLKLTYILNALPKNIHVKLLEEGIADSDNSLTRSEQLQDTNKFTELPITLPPYLCII